LPAEEKEKRKKPERLKLIQTKLVLMNRDENTTNASQTAVMGRGGGGRGGNRALHLECKVDTSLGNMVVYKEKKKRKICAA